MLVAFGTAALGVGATLLVPALEPFAPWHPGEPLPLVRTILPQAEARVEEDERGELVAATTAPDAPTIATDGALVVSPEVAVAAPGAQTAVPAAAPVAVHPGLPARPPGVPQPLVDADHRGMSAFYAALARNEGLVRAAHYGDSTIAADGISGTVRRRLQARFGDGGPGFVSAGNDPRWSVRPDVSTTRTGTWDTVSILLGGGRGHYGYGGTASTASDGSYTVVRTPKDAEGNYQSMSRLEIYLQRRPEAGSWWLSADDRAVGEGSGRAEGTVDEVHRFDVAGGYQKLAFGASGGPVTFYGVVMETAGPGVVWDALGVVGVGSKSFAYHHPPSFQAQVQARNPELLVLMIGGNETGFPALKSGSGDAYAEVYAKAVRTLRAGAPAASCLLVTPLDQGTREGGEARSKPAMSRLVGAQRRVAEAEGCAFWDARAAMGGEGAVVRWAARKPALAWADLLHLSAAGQDVVGQMLADAIEHGFDQWRAQSP